MGQCKKERCDTRDGRRRIVEEGVAPTVVGLSEIEWKRWREKERKDRLTNTKFELFLFLE